MRLLRFNDSEIDIDEETAIGIDLQAYSISDPSNRKINVSNDFTIPRTSRNMRAIGYAGNVQFADKNVYNSITCDYYEDSFRLISNGKAVVNQVSDRISVSLKERPAVWDLISEVLWGEFQSNFLTYLQNEKGLPSASAPFVGIFEDFINEYVSGEDLLLPMYLGNFRGYENPASPTNYLEDNTNIFIKYNSLTYGVDYQGGHFAAYAKSIFEYIEFTYGVDFGTQESFDYNIFQDTYGAALYTPLKNISIVHTGTGFYFKYNEVEFAPHDNTIASPTKTLFDFTKSYFQIFNCVIDKEFQFSVDAKYMIRRFDDIVNAEETDFSFISKNVTPSFNPKIEGYKQNNYIKFSKIFDDGDILINSKYLYCNNKNIEVGTPSDTLFTIDGYINSLDSSGVASLSQSSSLDTFSFFISNGTHFTKVSSVQADSLEVTTSLELQKAEMYGINGEYNTIDDIITYPVVYTIKKWLKLNDIANLQFFKRYFIRDLNGYFYLNKISGYNPSKSQDATTIELIKLP